jgi:lipoprotein-anchoring transpeptidase ErfK/SrfK
MVAKRGCDRVKKYDSMKSLLKQSALYLRRVFFLNAAVFALAIPARAGVRQDAETAVARLQQNSAAQNFPDDMKSLELVFEIAHRYQLNNDRESSDKFYLLALQKARIIEGMAKMSAPTPVRESAPPVVEAPAAAVEVPAPAAVEAPRDISAEPMPSPPPPVEVTPAIQATTAVEAAPVIQAAPVVEEVAPSTATAAPEREAEAEITSARLVGAKGVYTVVKGDSVRLVAAKLGVAQQHLRSMNGLDSKAKLKVGQKLAYNNRKIIPQQMKDGIVVNIPDRTLYYFQRGSLVTSLPVAVGSPTKNEKYIWQTPVGKFKITGKIKDPTWTVPTSIQSEMEEQGKDVLTVLPPGPDNPLGKYAMKTSIPGIMLHSTTRPASIYSFSSHGCIRISPDTMEDFFPQVRVNTRGEIIYKPVKLVVIENGRVFLEVHRDVYNKTTSLFDEAKLQIEKQKLSERVDWEKLKAVVKQKSGIAEDISL